MASGTVREEVGTVREGASHREEFGVSACLRGLVAGGGIEPPT